MIKAQEVRVGNWLLIGKSVMPGYILSIEFKREIMGYTINGYEEDLFSGIPLSEDILLKAGFEEHLDGMEERIFINDKLNASIIGNEVCLCRGRKITVLYVHQLQNLFYALTGTELDIKL